MKQEIHLDEEQLKNLIRDMIMETIDMPECDDPTPTVNDIAGQYGYSITDSYDKDNGIVYVLDCDTQICNPAGLQSALTDAMEGCELKFGTRTSPQMPEMKKLLLYVGF